MKKFFTAILAILWTSYISYGQIVITEISYNPPESGTDSLEYLELFNAGTTNVNLKDYKFTKGVEFTFPEISILAGKFLILSVKESAFMNVYGKTSLQWTAGALNNGGEVIAIADAAGTEFISVDLKDLPPWPGLADGTDGEGRSIELCNPLAAPSNGANWKVSVKDLGFQINGKQIYGTPGEANSITQCEAVPDHVVEVSSNVFTPKDITIDAGQTVRWVNKGGTHNINGTQATFSSNPEGFGNGAASSTAWTYDFKFTKEGLYNYRCDPHASFGMVGTVTVKSPVIVDMFPLRSITSVTTVNENGVVDSLNVNCTLTGVVYGVNLRPAGLQFTIIDANNNGIGAFSNSSTFDYTVKEGDEVEIKGKVAQFNGFTQLELAGVKKLTENKTLVIPKTVTTFTEVDESSLVTVNDLDYVDVADWTGAGSGFNVRMTNGTTVFTIRIDNDVDLFSSGPIIPIAGKKLQVTGLLGQFDSSSPFSEGYQLLPRYVADFEIINGLEELELDATMTLYPNPVTNIITVKTDSQPDQILVINSQGQTVYITQSTLEVDMSAIPAGVYFLKAIKGDKSSTLKVIKL